MTQRLGNNRIQDGAVTGNKIADDAVNSNNIVNGAITTIKLDNQSVDGDKLKLGAVSTKHFVPLSVRGNVIGITAVSTNNIVDGAITGVKVAANTLTGNNFINGSIAASKLNFTDTTGLTINANNIQDGAITEAKLGFQSGFYVYDLDDITPLIDGRTNTFDLTYNGESANITTPFNIQVTLDGVIQPGFINASENVWFSHVLSGSKGYTVVANSRIKFADNPQLGSEVLIRTTYGTTTLPTNRVYPFKPVDILVGD
jgi:hypothetical protein